MPDLDNQVPQQATENDTRHCT